MPPPIILQDLSGLAQGISGAGSALAQTISGLSQQRQEKEKKRGFQSILQETIGQLSEASTPTQIIGSFNKALQSGVPIDTLKASYSFFEPFIKSKLDEESDLRLFGNDLENLKDIQIDANDANPQDIQPRNQNKLETLQDSTLTKMLGSKKYGKWAEGELKRRETEQKRNSDLWNYKPTEKFIETIDKEARDAEFGNEVADSVIRLANSGRVSPSNFRNLAASQFGDKLPFLFSPESAEFKFLEKLQAKGLTAYFPRPTEKEFLFINSAQAQLGKTDQANIQIAELQKKFNNIPIRLSEIKDQIIEENNGVPPRDIAAKTRKRAQEVKNGIIADSAAITYRYGTGEQRKEAKDYLQSIKSPITHSLQPLPRSVAIRAYREAKGDKTLATQIILEQGYNIDEVLDDQ